MTSGVPLHNGGPLYHPDRQRAFHPALRGAAHLLVAGEGAAPGLARSLREEVLPRFPGSPAALAPHRLRFEAGGDGVRIGVRPRAFHRSRERRSRSGPPPGDPDRPGPLLDLAHHLLGWSRRHHLDSPHVLELLLRTLSAWWELDRRDEPVAPVPAAGSPAPPGPAVPESAAPWGPWVEVLTLDPVEVDPSLLLGLDTAVPFLDPPDLATLQRFGTHLTVQLLRWSPEWETWEEREQRLRQGFEAALERHRRATLRAYAAAGYRPVPVKTAHHHFDWLAHRQLHGRRPSVQARKAGVSPAAVRMALRELASLVELRLRRVKGGPEGW